jgi:D-galactarolactone cycloisomerase
MRIAAVKAHCLEAPIEQTFGFSQAWVDRRVGLIVEVTTEDGLTGWGESYGPPGPIAAVIETFRPWLVGRDARATDAIWEDLYNRLRDHGQKGVVVQALSGVDIALWDLKGKHFGVPVHVLLGGPLRTSVPIYATGLYRPPDSDMGALAAEAEGYVGQGIGAMKVKVGFGLDYDIKAVATVRRAIGAHVRLFMDANHGYDRVAAIRLAHAVAEHDIGWFEEPVPPEDLDGYCAVRAATDIPVAGGECEFTRYGFRHLMQSGAVDILQPDTCAAGGLSECKKIADMAVAFGLRYYPHVWGTGIAQAAALHLLAVLPNTPPALNAPEPLLEFDLTEHPFRHAILEAPITPEQGRVAVPDGPGLGVAVDRDALARFTVA